jgi:hypothetical protein
MNTFKSILLCAAIVLLAGSSISRAREPIPLRAGPVTMLFDADNVFLRYVRVGSHEVLRGINAPIRNQNWATVAPSVSNLQIEDEGDRFKVTFDVSCADKEIDFRWHGSISGSSKGVIEFTFDGVAHSTFKRNRIGFCVLHGPSAAGQSWVLKTADGATSTGNFPKFISPHQPAKNLREITHEVTPGIQARVEFHGEVFEMEDQRNWTDASFKTYCTPLEIPYPVEVAKGTKISQKITISLEGELGEPEATSADTVLTLTKKESALPRLGLQVSSEVKDLTNGQEALLHALRLDHLRVDLALSDKSFVDDLRRATTQAKALGVSLHIGLNLGESPAFAELLSELKKRNPPVTHWLVTGGEPAHFLKTRQQLLPVAGGAQIGVTRITNFVDLNRLRPEEQSIGAIGFAINPQIHAFDNASMVETLTIHADVVNTARQFAGERPLVIGPVTLSPQFVDGEDPPGGPPAGPYPTYVDVRQGTGFAAAWTLGSVKYLAESSAHSITYYETVGWNGIMDADDVGSRPAGYPSRPGETFPVYELLHELGEFAGGRVRQVDSSNPLSAVAIVLKKGDRTRLLVANLAAEAQTVTVRGFGKSPELRVTLSPHEVGLIDRNVD